MYGRTQNKVRLQIPWNIHNILSKLETKVYKALVYPRGGGGAGTRLRNVKGCDSGIVKTGPRRKLPHGSKDTLSQF